MAVHKLLVVDSQVIEVTLEQNVAAEDFFDGRLLWVGSGDGDATLPVAHKIHWLGELDASRDQLLLDALRHFVHLQLEGLLLFCRSIGGALGGGWCAARGAKELSGERQSIAHSASGATAERQRRRSNCSSSRNGAHVDSPRIAIAIAPAASLLAAAKFACFAAQAIIGSRTAANPVEPFGVVGPAAATYHPRPSVFLMVAYAAAIAPVLASCISTSAITRRATGFRRLLHAAGDRAADCRADSD